MPFQKENAMVTDNREDGTYRTETHRVERSSGVGRTILILLVLIVIIAIAAVATGFVNLSGKSGTLPKVAVEGGSLPSVTADVGSVDVGTKSTTVDVPKVEVGTTKEEVKTPTIDVKKAGE